MTSVTEEMIEAACKAFYGDDAWANPRGFISPPSSRIAMSRALEAALSASPAAQTEPVVIGYTNWRREYSVRRIVPIRLWYGSTEWHPEPQWLVKAIDVERGAERDFALKDFGPAPSAPQPTEPVAVKLEWDELGYATTPFGAYSVIERGNDSRWAFVWHEYPYGEAEGSFDTSDEAKAAAQADYNARILSALASPVAQQRDEVIEQCAKIALEDWTPGYGTPNAHIEHLAQRQREGIAHRIRKLLSPERKDQSHGN